VADVEPEGGRPNPLDAQSSNFSRQALRSSQAAPGVAVAVLYLHVIFEYLRIHEIWPILDQLKVQTAMFAALLLIVIGQTVREGVRLSRQSRLLLGFLGLTVFTILVAKNNFYAYEFSYALTLILIGYFAITHILRDERKLGRFLALLVGIHIYLAVMGIGGYSRSQFDEHAYASTGVVGGSFLGDENDLGLALVLILPFAIYLFRLTRSAPCRVFWGAGGVAILVTIVFTFSRGAFLGLVAMALYWVVGSRNRGKAICTLALAAALVIAIAPPQYWARVETIGDIDSGTAELRRNYWAAAGRMFLDSPLFGVGGNNAGVWMPDYAIDFPPEIRPNQWGRVIHSMYFQILAEFGLLGAFLIGSILRINFRNLRQVISLSRSGICSPTIGQLAECLRMSWVGFLVSAAFLSVLMYPHLYYLTALTVVVRDLASADEGAITIEPVAALEKVA